MEEIELVGYWNKSLSDPEIRFDIPEKYQEYQLVTVNLKPIEVSLDKDLPIKKLDRGLRKLSQTVRKLKYGR